MWGFLFGGRLSRIPYALIAVPILALQYTTPLIFNFAPVLFEHMFHASLVDIGGYMIALAVIVVFLPALVLVIASIKRLHDIRLPAWLILPLVLKLLIAPLAGFYTGNILLWLSRGAYFYSLLLVLALLIVPGRHHQSDKATASAAF